MRYRFGSVRSRRAATVLVGCTALWLTWLHSAAAQQAASAATDAGATLPSPGETSPGETVPAATAKIPICVPIGLAMNKQGELFVANHWGSGTTCSGGQITVYSATGTPLPSRTITTSLANPAGLAFDRVGNLYVADYQNQAVEVFSPQGAHLTGKTLHTDKNYNPSGVQVDKSGNVWVANRTNSNIGIGEIEIFHPKGAVTTITQGLVYPLGIVFQAGTGTAWVGNSETPNDTITTYSPAGKFLKAFPTPGFTPTYLGFGSRGNLIATDGLHSVIETFNTSGRNVGPTITTGLALPYGIAVTAEGDFYVANVGFGGSYNGSSITKYDESGKLLCTILATASCK